MNRRNVLLGASLATLPIALRMASAPALAQTTAAVPSSLGSTQYRTLTLMGGSYALQASKLAQQSATHPKVKQFADFEVAEQTTVAQVLTDTANPPVAPLDQPHAAMLASLQALSGRNFDRAYIAGQLQGHQELLEVQNAFLSDWPSVTSDSGHVAQLARTTIQMHIVLLRELSQTIQA